MRSLAWAEPPRSVILGLLAGHGPTAKSTEVLC